MGNWPGVTVEKKEGKLKGAEDVIIQDLPGIYSLSPYTLEEVVARSYLVNEKPDAILNIVDATNIERNLYLTTQLAELGIPMVIALNMIDVSRKNGDVIDLKRLGAALGCEVVETSALKGMGSKEVAQKAAALAAKRVHSEPPHVFAGSVEHALAHIEDLITHRDGQEAEHHHHADGSVHAGSIAAQSTWRAGTPSNCSSAMKESLPNSTSPAASRTPSNRRLPPAKRKWTTTRSPSSPTSGTRTSTSSLPAV